MFWLTGVLCPGGKGAQRASALEVPFFHGGCVCVCVRVKGKPAPRVISSIIWRAQGQVSVPCYDDECRLAVSV